MLMAIQFPDDLVIADFLEIKKIDFEPWLQRTLLSMNGIGMPIDFPSVIDLVVSKEMKFVSTDAIGLANDALGFLRQMFAQQCGALGGILLAEEESCGNGTPRRQEVLPLAETGAVEYEVKALGGFLDEPDANLVPAHCGKARPFSLPVRAHRSMLSCLEVFSRSGILGCAEVFNFDVVFIFL